MIKMEISMVISMEISIQIENDLYKLKVREAIAQTIDLIELCRKRQREKTK